MARVFRRPLSASARRAPTRVAKRKAQKHKVVMESVTQEKKKLRSVISFETKAPPGYTFISAGNPKVTNACKELCRKDGLKIFAVTTTPHMRTHNLSQHVHRIGFHFPSAVVATVCMDLGLSLTATGNVVPIHGVGGYTRHQDPDKSQMSQLTINTEARDVLKDLFPNIPDNDLNQIIKTSFQMGQRKVGTALELPLARRAQLAVVAHIRHVYTDYDRLLKVTSFHEARSVVEEPTLAKLVAWRGDDENGKTVLEDVFREVIVISDDDEDSDSDEGENVPPTNNRELSVEYVSSQARTVELPTGMVTYTNPASRECLRELSEDEAPQGFRVIPEVPRKNKIDRRGFSRYEAWDRAINRYRNVTNGADQNRFHGGSTDRQRPFYSTRQPPYGSVNVSTEPRHQVVSSQIASAAPPNIMRDHHVSAEKAPTVPLIGSSYGNWAQKESSCNILTSHVSPKVRPMPPLPGPSRQRNPDVVRLPDIVPLERAAPPLRNGHMSLRQYDSSAPVLLNDPQGFRDGNEAQLGHQPRTMGPSLNKGSNAQDRALPSIENPSSPKEIRRPGSGRLDHLSRRISGGLSIRSVTPQRLPHQENPQQDIGERPDDDQFPKRRRVAYHGSIHGDSHPGIAPGAVDSAVPTILKEPPGGKRYIPYGYVPSGHPSQDDSHVRRKYVTPVDPHFAGRWPERVQNPSVHAARVNTSSNIPVDGRRIDDRVGGHPAHHHSSVTLDDNSQRPVLSSSDSRVPRTYHGDLNHSVDDLRSLHMPEPRILSWRNQDNERLIPSQDVSQRRNFYADDFVRPVGLHEPRPLEYKMQRPHIQAQRATEIIPHTQGARVYDGKHNREEPVDTRSSMTYHDGRQPWLDYRAAPHSHEYAILDDKDRTMRDSRLFESSFVPRHYEQRHEGFLDSTRSMAIQPQYGLQTQDCHQPSYVRRVRQPEPPHPAPDGRTVVIVD